MKISVLKKRTLTVFVLTVFVLFPLGVLAQLAELENTAAKAGLGKETDISTIVGKIIGIVFTLMGIILLVLIIVAGIMWMTSGGSEEQVKKAKGIFKSAFIGLIIIILAYAISRFVIANLTEVTQKSSQSITNLFS